MHNKTVFLIALGVASTFGVCNPVFAAGTCDNLLPPEHISGSNKAVTAEVLASLRDAGPIYHYQADRPILALSPDKQSAAFEIHRGDSVTNSYCVGIVILPLKPGGRAYLADVGDELILDPHPSKGWAAFESGSPLPITPRWAPSGRWLAFLKRMGGSTQVWRVNLDDKHIGPLTRSIVDVDDFRITPDGSTVVYASRPGLVEHQAAIDGEGITGWRYDARVLPVRGARPQTPNVETTYTAVILASGIERPASPTEVGLFQQPIEVPKEAPAYALGPGGRTAWIEPTDPGVYPRAYDLVAKTPTGRQAVCKASICAPYGLTGLWWSDDGTRLRFTRREGWADSLTAIYEWLPGQRNPRRLYVTSDALIECQPSSNDLICFRERSNEPRQVVKLGIGGEQERTLFETNPEFSTYALGRVERLNWRNAFDVKFYGDLVYPTDYVPGVRFPLVIVQYRTRGFLRGGVGDEMPIQAFANRGYFVLVLDIGDEARMVGSQASAIAQQITYYRDHFGLKNILSGVEIITQSLIDKGLVDRERIGIHGLSAGSQTVQYAAINSSLFSAGSVSGCCWEPDQDAYLGQSISEGYHQLGWPRLVDNAPTFWSQISLMREPQKVKFPLLFQAADNEFLVALGAYTAMAQAFVPTDMFVFPDEYHIKWQPAHRLATYKRNLAWFDFWLKGQLSGDPEQRAEAVRWGEMQKKWRAANKEIRP